MKLDCTMVLKTLSGESVLDGSKAERAELTLGKALATILTAPRQNNNLDTFRAWVLAQKFYSCESVDVDKETKKFLETALSTYPEYSPILTGQIREMLEDKEEEKVEDEKSK